MSFKNKVLLGGWISTGAKIFRRDKNMRGKKLPGRFADWMYRECGIKNKHLLIYKNSNLYVSCDCETCN